jgi:integrase
MTRLHGQLADYLMLRRALGYKLERVELLLGQFIAYLATTPTPETFTINDTIRWATSPGGSRWWHAQRLSAVRGFATYLHAIDPTVPVPPADLLPGMAQRAVPYLYPEQDICGLLDATDLLRQPFRQITYRTLIGLLAATGIRVGEAIRLDVGDVDVDNQMITIRHSKFDKSRHVPIHRTVTTVLDTYLNERRRCPTPPTCSAVFVSPAGTRLLASNVESTFRILVKHAGLQRRAGRCRPRMHDLRHSFAIATLLDAYRTDGDPATTMAVLSTYLGHVDPNATYWYLSGAPELLAFAAERLEQHQDGRR